MADDIEEGIQLNVPCRVITKPSADGKYLDIDQVFPAEEQQRRATVSALLLQEREETGCLDRYPVSLLFPH
jgi:hypothetical protein